MPPPALRFLALLATLLLALPAPAQILPDLSGDALQTALRDAYAPERVLSSSQSKDRLYDTVDVDTLDGTEGVRSFYTDLFVPFDGVPSTDPSQDVFNNEAGLNQEHLWPRSEGTDDNAAEVDLHHLVPTRVRVNSDRASLPFAEIPDASAVAWYILDQTQSNPPDTDRDAYSERSPTAFEPREVVKGDVARALFYVATVYDAKVGASGRAWFERQLPTLLAWHEVDPPTAAEVARSGRVAALQGTDNPYVLDATLARRAFAPAGVATGDAAVPAAIRFDGPYPNPSAAVATLVLTLDAPQPVRVVVFDRLGRCVAMLHDGPLSAGAAHAFTFSGADLPVGLYVIRATGATFVATRRVTLLR